ncbi:MAG: hypothetical protein IT515_13375 [Burkholderiales bacterium]|nr:hypothetical protein [Burkholderiales bacterium]
MKTASASRRIGQRVLRTAGAAALALVLAGAMTAASAQSGRNGDRGSGDRGPQQVQPGDMSRRGDMRGTRDTPDRGQIGGGTYRQLSPEEREQLRRDIRDHGRDVYGDREQRRRSGPAR